MNMLLKSLLILITALPALAINKNPLTASAYLERSILEPGANTPLTVEIKLAKEHFAYEDQFKFKPANKDQFLISTYKISPIIEFADTHSKKIKKAVKDKATLTSVIELPLDTPLGKVDTSVKLTYQACTKKYCLLPITIDVPFSFTVVADINSARVEETKTIEPTSSSFDLDFKNKSLWLIFLTAFIAGILTSFTPCVFPMIPITLAVIGNRAHARSKTENFIASLIYVLGISITYSVLGVFAAHSGSLFGSYMQSPAVILFISFVFFLMALSMFGMFELQLPQFIVKPIDKINLGYGNTGVFATGVVAGLVASPCVGPVLVGILTFIAKSQDLVLGFFLMMTFAFGMGLLFIALGTSSSLVKKLPKSGQWMNRIKYFFGVLMIGVSAYFAWPVAERYLMTTDKSEQKLGMRFIPYTEEAYVEAKANGKPMIIDFWADWCAACIEFEKKTFTNPKLVEFTKDFILLKFDATENSPLFDKLRSRYQIFGLPHLVFYNSNGEYQEGLTLTGFEEAPEFLKRIQSLK